MNDHIQLAPRLGTGESGPGSRLHRWINFKPARIAVVTIAYVLTRAGNLSRELVPEEGLFMMPGRELFLGHGFDLFSKPPLTSLLLGAFSFAGQDMISGARLVPFLVGLFLSILPLLLTGSVLPSALVLLSPFFFAASAHMQTDPTVGLLGYGLFSAALFRWYTSEGKSGVGLLWCALLILWLGKIEIAAIATVVAAIVAISLRPPQPRKFFLAVMRASAAGVLLFIVLTWLLGLSAGVDFSGSVGEVVRTITRISGSLVQVGIVEHDSDIDRRQILYGFLSEYGAPSLFALALIPSLLSLSRESSMESPTLRRSLALLVAGIVPVVIYFAGGYVGDGFPRYFLIVFPPLLILLGDRMGLAPRPDWIAWVVVVAGVFLMGPDIYRLWRSPASITVARGTIGYRGAAELITALTRRGDSILGPEPSTYYSRSRNWVMLDHLLPYPDKHAAAMVRAETLTGAIVPRLPPPPHRYDSFTGRMVEVIERKGSCRYFYGSFEIIVARSRVCEQLFRPPA